MFNYIKIDIAGMESNMINTLKEKAGYTDVKVINRKKDKSIQLKILKPLNEDTLLTALDNFLINFKKSQLYELMPSWSFDEENSIIKGPSSNYFLTKKEALFLKLLIKHNCTLTYSEMIKFVWEKDQNVSQNAMRLFTRNLRKKLPPNILKNLQGIGYRLVL